MSWIDVISEADAKGKLAEVYETISGARGKVSNIMRVHSLNPRAMQAHMKLYLSVMFGKSGLSREERELIATAVSLVTGYFNFVNRIAQGLGVSFSEEEMSGYDY